MSEFVVNLLDFVLFPFASFSPLVVVPLGFLCVIASFRFFKRLMVK